LWDLSLRWRGCASRTLREGHTREVRGCWPRASDRSRVKQRIWPLTSRFTPPRQAPAGRATIGRQATTVAMGERGPPAPTTAADPPTRPRAPRLVLGWCPSPRRRPGTLRTQPRHSSPPPLPLGGAAFATHYRWGRTAAASPAATSVARALVGPGVAGDAGEGIAPGVASAADGLANGATGGTSARSVPGRVGGAADGAPPGLSGGVAGDGSISAEGDVVRREPAGGGGAAGGAPEGRRTRGGGRRCRRGRARAERGPRARL